jgi:hypothetical protein
MALRPQPRPDFRWIGEDGKPQQVYLQYMAALDALVRALAAGQIGTGILTAVAAPSNANAAAAGVQLGQLYTGNTDPFTLYIRTV